MTTEMPGGSLEADLMVARHAAEQAGEIIRRAWGQSLQVWSKGKVDLVTEIDLAAEKAIVSTLRSQRPADRIIGEEGGQQESGGGARTWFVDPLDGTTNFSHGVPHFCVSVGLVDDEGPRVGVVYEPLRQWCFSALRGGGAWLNGQRLNVSTAPDLGQSVLATGFPYNKWVEPDNNGHRFTHLLRKTRGLRRMGAAALDLCYVAAGWFDGYWEFRLKPWDVAAGVLLVTEAGGKVSSFEGGPIDLQSGALVATNGMFHVELINALAEAEETRTS
ncbi:MAG: inositol monophosphatase family protein [Bradymonadia bacterium]